MDLVKELGNSFYKKLNGKAMELLKGYETAEEGEAEIMCKIGGYQTCFTAACRAVPGFEKSFPKSYLAIPEFEEFNDDAEALYNAMKNCGKPLEGMLDAYWGAANGAGEDNFLELFEATLSAQVWTMEMKVTNKKGAGFYIRSASNFLQGVPAQEAKEDKDALTAKDPVDELKISGLGDSINIAVATAAAVCRDKLASISKIETDYPEISDRGCAQIMITLTRNK
mmetsp:Transcript_88130/g.139283  ORF Transcript_88130/g.139283 Transcript_88130/m.139283 type:complete len:225 (-) Transcript_88130:63-737(-)